MAQRRSWREQVTKDLLSLDVFREVPTEYTEATMMGSVVSLVTLVLILVLFVYETSSFMDRTAVNTVVIDSNHAEMLQINFDISFWDLGCEYIQVGVWDSFGSERLNITKNIVRYDILEKGVDARVPVDGAPDPDDELHGSITHKPGVGEKILHLYSADEMLALDVDSYSAEEMVEYDRDWSSRDDLEGSTHEHNPDEFENVIQSHDYVFVNFFAGWCSHCREFEPTWDSFSEQINSGEVSLHDGDGNLLNSRNFRSIKINCVDFEETCRSEHVRAYPTIRLYRRTIIDEEAEKRKNSVMGPPSGGDGLASLIEMLLGAQVMRPEDYSRFNFVEFMSPDRSIENLIAFSRSELKSMHKPKDLHYHRIFDVGCRLIGSTKVSRVPGTLHFEATHSKDLNLNYALTNVSHTINHLSFSNVDEEEPDLDLDAIPQMDSRYESHSRDLTGESFITESFHQSPHHYLQVVSTIFTDTGQRIYQLTHQHRMASTGHKSAPQAKLSYALSPVEVQVKFGKVRWYGYIVNTVGLIGGAFTCMALAQVLLSSTAKVLIKSNMGKQG